MTVKDDIEKLADKYSKKLKSQMDDRVIAMSLDDTSHYLIYRVLGISFEEGKQIDIYQNKGRFLYKYAGSFLEDAAKICFRHTFPTAKSLRIPNTIWKKPKTFEIDCLIGNEALEIKWRDATTDGDHITKEHTRLRAVKSAGYTPIRLMFYYPNREQAIKIQKVIEDLYKGLNGHYYYADSAWDFVLKRTTIDLKSILEEIAKKKNDK